MVSVSMVHSETNCRKTLRFTSALRNKSGGALQSKMVHLETNFGAPQSKEWCTPKQETVHREANFGALRNNAAPLEGQDFQATRDGFQPLDILKQFRYF
jgi:hypothetical protein